MTVDEYRAVCEKKFRGKAAASEHDLQTQCVNWFRYTNQSYAKLLFAIPNGSKRSRFERIQALQEGLLSGVPDLYLAVARNGYHGLWIEMKNGKAGKVSDNQAEMIARLREEGYACYVCRTFDEFEDCINNYMK